MTASGSGDWLEAIVQAIEHEVLRIIQESFRPATRDRVLQDVANGAPEIRSPDERNRIDAGIQQRRPQVGHLLNCGVLGREPAVRVEQQVLDG